MYHLSSAEFFPLDIFPHSFIQSIALVESSPFPLGIYYSWKSYYSLTIETFYQRASSSYCYPGSTWRDTTLQNRWPGDIRTAMRATSETGRGMTMMLGMQSCYCVACRGPIRNTSSPILIHLSAYGLGCSKEFKLQSSKLQIFKAQKLKCI